jgi:threonine/homoserine/homoserine lactone efflux protein
MTAEQLSAALQLGLAAFVVGLSGAMSPGSYLTVTIARTMRRGPFSASLMLVGHAALEALLLVGFAFGLDLFLRQPTVVTGLSLIGGAVLLWMAWGLGRGAWTGSIVSDLEHSEEAAVKESKAGPVAEGAIVSLSNPYWTLWWATIGVKLASDALAIGPVGVLAFFIGHELADVAWYSFVIFAVSRGRGLLSPRVYRIVMGVLAAFLLFLGGRFVIGGIQGIQGF